MNTLTTFKRAMENALTKTDDSFPYVLVSSLLGTVVSLASVWAWTATTLDPLRAPRGFASLHKYRCQEIPP